MDREAILSSLVRFDTSIEHLRTALGSLDWDADLAVTLERRDIVAVLQRYAAAEIDASTVEDWANLIECREDIQFESGYEEAIAAAIFDLANPVLNGQLQTLLPDILSSLR